MDRCNILIAINTAATITLGVLLLLIKIELTGLRQDMPQPVPSISVEGGTATGNTVTVHQGDKPESNREWFTSRDVAEKEGVDPRTVLQWIEDGELPAEKVGKEWRIPLDYQPPN